MSTTKTTARVAPDRAETYLAPAEIAPARARIAPAKAEIDPAFEIADLLGQVVRRLHRGTSAALAPLGLSRAQSRVVRLLADGPLRMATIADRLAVVPRTVTDLVDGIEAAGLVARHPDPEDRRSTLVALTAGGRLLLDRLEVARRESAEQAFGRLDPADRSTLLRLLRDLATEPADPCGPAR